MLSSKIDFLAVISVENANPNGDPLNGNRPRQHYDNTGFITPVCIKRKIRNRLQDMGRKILIQQNDRSEDGLKSIDDRLNSVEEIADTINKISDAKKDKKKLDKSKEFLAKSKEFLANEICENFDDVRAFGATIANKKGDNSLSIGIRGPVTIQQAQSVGSVDIDSVQITKSTNSVTDEKDPDKKGEDTMGMMHTVRCGVYVIKGSINPILAKKTKFSDQDAEHIREALRTLFVNDESAARPAGTMTVRKLYWWKQPANDVRYSTRDLMDTIEVRIKSPDGVMQNADDFEIVEHDLPDLKPEVLEGV